MANSVDPEQTAPIGAVCSGSTLFASFLNSSVMLGNYLQQTTSADNIFRYNFFLGALRDKTHKIFKRLAKALIRLCVGCSEPLPVTHTTFLEISCHGSNVSLIIKPITFHDVCRAYLEIFTRIFSSTFYQTIQVFCDQ